MNENAGGVSDFFNSSLKESTDEIFVSGLVYTARFTKEPTQE